MNCPANLLVLSGELALPKIRVARVSRLIGNFDTTAKGYGWQVEAGVWKKRVSQKETEGVEFQVWAEDGEEPQSIACQEESAEVGAIPGLKGETPGQPSSRSIEKDPARLVACSKSRQVPRNTKRHFIEWRFGS